MPENSKIVVAYAPPLYLVPKWNETSWVVDPMFFIPEKPNENTGFPLLYSKSVPI
jgi:hypothetical protein